MILSKELGHILNPCLLLILVLKEITGFVLIAPIYIIFAYRKKKRKTKRIILFATGTFYAD